MPEHVRHRCPSEHDEQDFAPLGDALMKCTSCGVVVDKEFQPIMVDSLDDEDGGDEHLS